MNTTIENGGAGVALRDCYKTETAWNFVREPDNDELLSIIERNLEKFYLAMGQTLPYAVKRNKEEYMQIWVDGLQSAALHWVFWDKAFELVRNVWRGGDLTIATVIDIWTKHGRDVVIKIADDLPDEDLFLLVGYYEGMNAPRKLYRGDLELFFERRVFPYAVGICSLHKDPGAVVMDLKDVRLDSPRDMDHRGHSLAKRYGYKGLRDTHYRNYPGGIDMTNEGNWRDTY